MTWWNSQLTHLKVSSVLKMSILLWFVKKSVQFSVVMVVNMVCDGQGCLWSFLTDDSSVSNDGKSPPAVSSVEGAGGVVDSSDVGSEGLGLAGGTLARLHGTRGQRGRQHGPQGQHGPQEQRGQQGGQQHGRRDGQRQQGGRQGQPRGRQPVRRR